MERPALRISKLRLGIGLFILLALIVFTIHHLAEARDFARLVQRSQPSWLLLALGLQIATYVCAGGIWHAVAVSAGHQLRIVDLARLSVEKLSIDQFIPAGGMAGNVVVVKALRRLGLPAALATEAMLIDILAFYIAYATVGAAALWVLWLRHEVTRVVVALVLAFCVILAAVPLGIVWLLRHRDWQPPAWLARLQPLTRLRETVSTVSVQRVRSPRLLATAALLHTAIFLLDGATLWAMLKALGTPFDISSCFVALVMASMAGTVSFLPGGIGGFEVGMTATLVLLGAPLDLALTGTLLTRGLDLWIPLVPGLIFARRELWPGGPQPAQERARGAGVRPGAVSGGAPGRVLAARSGLRRVAARRATARARSGARHAGAAGAATRAAGRPARRAGERPAPGGHGSAARVGAPLADARLCRERADQRGAAPVQNTARAAAQRAGRGSRSRNGRARAAPASGGGAAGGAPGRRSSSRERR